MRKVLHDFGLENMFESYKEQVAEAVQNFVEDYHSLTESDPLEKDVKVLIRILIQYLPQLVKFKQFADVTPDLKDTAMEHLINEFFNFSNSTAI